MVVSKPPSLFKKSSHVQNPLSVGVWFSLRIPRLWKVQGSNPCTSNNIFASLNVSYSLLVSSGTDVKNLLIFSYIAFTRAGLCIRSGSGWSSYSTFSHLPRLPSWESHQLDRAWVMQAGVDSVSARHGTLQINLSLSRPLEIAKHVRSV